MTNNAVAGSERSGYAVAGQPCDSDSLWSGNVAHGALIGTHIRIKHLVYYRQIKPSLCTLGKLEYHAQRSPQLFRFYGGNINFVKKLTNLK